MPIFHVILVSFNPVVLDNVLFLNLYFFYPAASSNEWSPWNPCSVTCGMGQQERSRDCGSACREMETQACYGKPCYGACNFPLYLRDTMKF